MNVQDKGIGAGGGKVETTGLFVGVGVCATATVAEHCAVPPEPWKVPVNVVVWVGFMICVPLVPLPPLVMVPEVALVEPHVRVDDWPEVMEVGEAVRVQVGAGWIDWTTPAGKMVDHWEHEKLLSKLEPVSTVVCIVPCKHWSKRVTSTVGMDTVALPSREL